MAQPLPSTGYCPGFTGTMGVSDFLSGVWLPCFLHLSAILPVGRPDRISTVPPLSCVSSPVLRPRPLLSSSIVQMTAVACSVSDRIGKENLYFGAESAGSLTPLTTLSPDVTASDPSLGNSADAAYCVGLTPTEQRELQSSWALTTRAALRRCAPSARTRKKTKKAPSGALPWGAGCRKKPFVLFIYSSFSKRPFSFYQSPSRKSLRLQGSAWPSTTVSAPRRLTFDLRALIFP